MCDRYDQIPGGKEYFEKLAEEDRNLQAMIATDANVNEFRKLRGLEPVEGGDVPISRSPFRKVGQG